MAKKSKRADGRSKRRAWTNQHVKELTDHSRGSFGCLGTKAGTGRRDHGHTTADELIHERRQAIVLAFQPVVLDNYQGALRSVAAALRRHGWLCGEEVVRLVRGSDAEVIGRLPEEDAGA